MEISTISKEEIKRDNIQNNVNDIFGQSHYIKKTTNAFSDIKMRIQDMIDGMLSKGETTIDDEINTKFLDLDFASEFNINADKIGVNDAIFFINLLNQENLINYTVNNDSVEVTSFDGKKINASSPLLNLLKTSYDSKKPVRLDFDNDITVILKLDSNGKIQAHFIPGTSEVESYLKNNINCLKQQFDNENINYSELSYSKYKDKNNGKKQKRSNR